MGRRSSSTTRAALAVSACNKYSFIQSRDIPAGAESGDGMAIDMVVGIPVFDASGKYLCRFSSAEPSANIAFGGLDKRTLYMTGGQWLYCARMLSPGLDRLGK
jgi:hypothetical protein